MKLNIMPVTKFESFFLLRTSEVSKQFQLGSYYALMGKPQTRGVSHKILRSCLIITFVIRLWWSQNNRLIFYILKILEYILATDHQV